MALDTFRRNARVTVQESVTAADTQGGRTTTWTTRATVWANVATQGAMPEYLAEARVAAVMPYVVTIAYHAKVSGIGPTWRLLYGSRVLDVASVEDVDSKRQLIRVTCREAQA